MEVDPSLTAKEQPSVAVVDPSGDCSYWDDEDRNNGNRHRGTMPDGVYKNATLGCSFAVGMMDLLLTPIMSDQ